MAEKTAISWTRSTFNGWRGCEEVGPGCDNCYARVFDERFWGGAHWGPDHKRRLASDDYWREPLKWNKRAPSSEFAGIKGFWPVFAIAHGDIFDKYVPQEWRDRLFALIRATPNLTWQFVTKRIGNAEKMLPADWGDGYPNVWMLATMVNQEELDRDLPKLMETPAIVRGLSVEPQLGNIMLSPRDETLKFLSRFYGPDGFDPDGKQQESDRAYWLVPKLDWVITGGESMQRGQARGYNLAWPRALVKQCFHGDIPVWVKQLGARPYTETGSEADNKGIYAPVHVADSHGAKIDEWPVDLRIQQFPKIAMKVPA